MEGDGGPSVTLGNCGFNNLVELLFGPLGTMPIYLGHQRTTNTYHDEHLPPTFHPDGTHARNLSMGHKRISVPEGPQGYPQSHGELSGAAG